MLKITLTPRQPFKQIYQIPPNGEWVLLVSYQHFVGIYCPCILPAWGGGSSKLASAPKL